jgi:hypothetical protein
VKIKANSGDGGKKIREPACKRKAGRRILLQHRGDM